MRSIIYTLLIMSICNLSTTMHAAEDRMKILTVFMGFTKRAFLVPFYNHTPISEIRDAISQLNGDVFPVATLQLYKKTYTKTFTLLELDKPCVHYKLRSTSKLACIIQLAELNQN